MRFSILLATLDRTREVDHFLRSLASQTCRDFEVLVVDQNPDDRLLEILERYSGQFPIQHLRCERGHSKAFNFGLLKTSGEIIAFPDDDCWYDPDLLERVADAFETHPEASGITGREIVEPGFTCGGRWDSTAGVVTPSNVWRRAISFSMFLRRSTVTGVSFDETLGVGAGTPWGAGEETDYLLHLIEQGHQIFYDPSVAIWHQGRSGPYTPQLFSKARNYGMGMGRVLRKHRYPSWSVAQHLVRPLGGALQSAMTGRLQKAHYHWSVFAGRSRGWADPVRADAPPRRGREMTRAVRRFADNQLVQNAAALYGVQGVRKLLPLIIVPYLAWTLGPAGWGMVAFVQSLAEFAVLVIEFGFNLSATREIAQNRDCPKTLGEIMSGVLGAQFLLASAAVLIVYAVSRSLPMLHSNPRLVAAGLFYAMGQGFIPLWFYQGLERMRLGAALEVSGRLIGLALVFVFIHSPDDTWKALFIQGVAPFLATAAGLVVACRTIPFRLPTWQLVHAALRRGWPLFVFRSAESLYGVGNAFILGLFAPAAAVGYFASAEKISRAIFGLLNPIRDALYPRLSHLAHHSPAGAARLARIGGAVMVSGGILLGAATFLFSPVLIKLLMGQAFAPAVTVLRIFSMLPALLSITHSVGIQWLLPRGRDAELNRIILLAGALNVILAVFLAPHFAHLGMAWAVCCAEAFVCIGTVRATLRPQPPVWDSVPVASFELT